MKLVASIRTIDLVVALQCLVKALFISRAVYLKVTTIRVRAFGERSLIRMVGTIGDFVADKNRFDAFTVQTAKLATIALSWFHMSARRKRYIIDGDITGRCWTPLSFEDYCKCSRLLGELTEIVGSTEPAITSVSRSLPHLLLSSTIKLNEHAQKTNTSTIHVIKEVHLAV